MYQQMRVCALIPARARSKGLPAKNTRIFCGKPLLAWSIKQALGSRYIDRVIVSTEDEGIALIAARYKAEVPFQRPRYLSEDKTPMILVVRHSLAWLQKQKDGCDILVLLQPTSPLRASFDIDNAIRTMFAKSAQAVVAVSPQVHHPFLSNILPKDLCMRNFIPAGALNKNRQKLPRYYRINGALYLGRPQYIQSQNGFLGPRTFAYIMPPQRSIDIDTEVDFVSAQTLMKKAKTHGAQ